MNETDSSANGKVIDLSALRSAREQKQQRRAGAALPAPKNHDEALQWLRDTETLWSLVSAASRLAYVVCDVETGDDELLLFPAKSDAEQAAKKLIAEGTPVGVLHIEEKQKLPFYGSLYRMGINAMLLCGSDTDGIRVQLHELVSRKPRGEGEKQIVENPSFLLTALYYAQETRKSAGGSAATQERQQELQEEMLADFRRGTFLLAYDTASKQTPLLKLGEELFHPVFTDIETFRGFNREGKFMPVMLPANELPKRLAPNAAGVVVNPLDVNIVLNLRRNQT